MAANIKYINVLENRDALYQYMIKYDFLPPGSPKTMPDDFDELSWFDGDPDMIKIDGQVGYFDFSPCDTNRENKCFYWYECFNQDDEQKVVSMLKEFKSYNLKTAEPNNWDTWHRMESGIAFRGGHGYLYIIYMAPPKSIYTINLIDEITCEDITPIKYAVDYASMDDAIDAAREAIKEFPSSDYSFVEGSVYGGEYRNAFGDVFGEPEAIYTISNISEEKTKNERARLGYCSLTVDEYAE